MKILKDNILIEKKEITNTTESGIVLPENEESVSDTGKVVQIGKEVEEIKKGDVIRFKPHLFEEIKIGNDSYLIGKESGVMIVL